MIEQQRQRIEQEITKVVDDTDKEYLRKMQVEMHRCAAKCCEDQNSSVDVVQRCVERCTTPVTRAQRFVQNELESYQQRLQRCVMQCNDDIRAEMSPNPNETEVARYTDKFERCAIKCVDKHLGQIPQLMKTIRSVLSKGVNNIPEV
ncbi:protein FAM136A [Condylostylus longicornis]|uniref:protein FAM136A n=1 Tax=Condylostylus longicornis TaxID=2530218 RepID=UPI00244E5145|nr:protein FAM136A [Condylostylus longicornis]